MAAERDKPVGEQEAITGFRRDQEMLVMERVNVILFLGWALVPFFGIIDYILYPQYSTRFIIYRLIAAACCFALQTINKKKRSGVTSFYLGIAAFYIVGLAIIAMILETGGYGTPYYAGLSLVFLGWCTVLTVPVKLLAAHSLILYAIYILSVVLFLPYKNGPLFLSNNTFLASTLVIGLIASKVSYELRFKEYLGRTALEKAQDQLKCYSEQLEKLFAKSERNYQVLFENANEGIFVLQGNVIQFCNPSTTDLFGYSERELAHIPFVDLVVEEDRGLLSQEQQPHAVNLKTIPTTATFRIAKKSGDMAWVDMNAVNIEWAERPGLLVFLRDVTEKKLMEQELLNAEKMKAIGTLAGGIAHDFNNLLMGILGYVSLLLLNTEDSDPRYAKMSSIEKLVDRGANLTKQLLGFARGGKYEVKPTDPNGLVSQSSDLFGHTRQELTIHRTYEQDAYAVDVDRGQIEQVLLNLYVNAWQAMPSGGELHLETKNVTLDQAFCTRYSLKPGNYVRISVTDTGIGMDQATQQRIFEPFFTTKEMGRGTGLGLASAYGIIKNHNGLITVSSEVGRGTTFDIYLPASEKEAIRETVLSAEVVRSAETVLLVDDQDMILTVGEEMLKAIGYEVVTAQDGTEAVDIYKTRGKEIDIIILDMVMPSMGGGEAFDRLKAFDPGVKVILSSGYSIDGHASEIIERGCSGFIQKPFSISELSQKIREVLDNRSL